MEKDGQGQGQAFSDIVSMLGKGTRMSQRLDHQSELSQPSL